VRLGRIAGAVGALRRRLRRERVGDCSARRETRPGGEWRCDTPVRMPALRRAMPRVRGEGEVEVVEQRQEAHAWTARD
jgi:hypothetical protein